MAYTQTSMGAACGIPQGELQGSLSNLKTICTILTPMMWGRIYAYGVRVGVPSLFYGVSAGAGLVQLLILHKLFHAPGPPAKHGGASGGGVPGGYRPALGQTRD